MTKIDKKLKTVSIKWKPYVEVKERILALSENTNYSIETEYNYFSERKMWVVKAKLTLIDTWEVYNWLAQEIESDDYKQVNHTSALENAETSAVWRACAFAWIGIIDWIASADEVNKAINRWSQFKQSNWRNLAEIIADIKQAETKEKIIELKDEAKQNQLSEKQTEWLKKEYEAKINSLSN